MRDVDWAAEGAPNGQPSRLRRRAHVTCQDVLASESAGAFSPEPRWHRELTRARPWTNHTSGTGFIMPGPSRPKGGKLMALPQVTPSLGHVRDLAAKGYRRVPVKRELYADSFTTVEVLRALRAQSSHVFMLESAEADQHWAATRLSAPTPPWRSAASTEGSACSPTSRVPIPWWKCTG